jgi:hypothetical protein
VLSHISRSFVHQISLLAHFVVAICRALHAILFVVHGKTQLQVRQARVRSTLIMFRPLLPEERELVLYMTRAGFHCKAHLQVR